MSRGEYKINMISFDNTDEGGSNVITKNGGNVQPWHIPILKDYIEELEAKLSEEADFDDLC